MDTNGFYFPAYHLFRVGFAFFIVFGLWPVFMFPKEPGVGLERFFSRYIKMVALIIIAGYVLVFFRLYEWLSIAVVLFLFMLRRTLNWSVKLKGISELWDTMSVLLLDLLDGQVKLRPFFTSRWISFKAKIREGLKQNFGSLSAVVRSAALLATLTLTAYYHFADAFHHVAPAMSDSYVTLAWMKYVDQKALFHDGIYPYGFHIYLSMLRKFSSDDAVYVLRYTGPWNSVLITLGVYLLVSRLTRKTTSGIVAAFAFGVLGGLLFPALWEREAASNSQEFALLFLLPAWYFTMKYFQSEDKGDLWTAIAACAVIGLVHTLVLAFWGVGLCILLFVRLVIKFRATFKLAKKLILLMLIAGFISGLPLLLGLIAGKHLHSASVEFLLTKMEVAFPIITFIDWVPLAGFAAFPLWIFSQKPRREAVISAFFISILGFCSFAMYYTLGPLTSNAIMVSRMTVLWGMLIPVGIACGWTVAAVVLFSWGKFLKPIESLVCTGILIWALSHFQPTPPAPYKMQYDSMVEQYLRISAAYVPTQWMMVSSEEGYDLALGKGWHMNLQDFVKEETAFTQKGERDKDYIDVLNTPDIFIFYEKNIFDPHLQPMDEIIAGRIKSYAWLSEWIKQYKKTHEDWSVVYEDKDIFVFRIHRVQNQNKLFQQTWGLGWPSEI